jgi:Tfp pilus assembly PilM family ATPase
MKINFNKMPKLSKVPGLPKASLPPSLSRLKSLAFPSIRAKQNVVALEIGEDWLKIVISEGGKLRGAAVEPVSGQSELEISQKLAAFLQAKAFKPTRVLISHPTHNLTTRILALPSTDAKEIKDIVELQAVKQTPYNRDEITTGFYVIETDATGYSRVLVAISHREVVLRYFRIVELAGLNPDMATMALEGSRFWYPIARPAVKSNQEITLLLDVDWTTTDFLIFKGEKLVFNRSVGIGAKNFKEQGAMIESEWVREIQRSIESGDPEIKGEKITAVAVTGIGNPLKDLCALLVRELNLPCEVIPVFEGLPSQGLELSEAQRDSASMLSLAGLALHPFQAVIDLTPPEIQVRHTLQERAKDLALLGTLLLGLVMMLSLVGFEKVYKRMSYLESLKKEYKKVSVEAEGVERIVAKMKLAKDQSSGGNGVLDVLKDISEVLPKNITMTSFEYNGDAKTILIRGISEEMSAVFQVLSIFESTPSLELVKTRNVAKRKVEEKEVAEFEITASITKPGAVSSPVRAVSS